MKWVEDKDMVLWNQRAAARNTQYDRANAMMPDAFEKKKPRKIKKVVSKLKKVQNMLSCA